MRETIKVMCMLALMVGAVGAALAWSDRQPDAATKICRFAMPLVAAAGVVVFLVLHFQRDRAPDFLRRFFPVYYDRGGLCFAFRPLVREQHCIVQVVFQNRHDRPCRAAIALRPSEVFGWIAHEKIPLAAAAFECPPGGFGAAYIPLAIPELLQGKKQVFQIGATVEYPEGKGRTLRYASNHVHMARHNAAFRSRFDAWVGVLGLLGGHLHLARPPLVRFTLPRDVADAALTESDPAPAILWKLGDPSALSIEAELKLRSGR